MAWNDESRIVYITVTLTVLRVNPRSIIVTDPADPTNPAIEHVIPRSTLSWATDRECTLLENFPNTRPIMAASWILKKRGLYK